jgi:hypothetical protein
MKKALANNGSSAPPMSPDPDPVHAGRLERPQRRGLAVVERERDRHRREDRGQREECARQQRESGIRALAQAEEEQRVGARQRERAPRGAVSRIADERRLQRETDQRDAEHQ